MGNHASIDNLKPLHNDISVLVRLAGLEPAARGLGNIRPSKSDLENWRNLRVPFLLSYPGHGEQGEE